MPPWCSWARLLFYPLSRQVMECRAYGFQHIDGGPRQVADDPVDSGSCFRIGHDRQARGSGRTQDTLQSNGLIAASLRQATPLCFVLSAPVVAHMAGWTQRAQFCLGVVWIVVDVRRMQVDKVQVVVMLAHAQGALPDTAVFTAIVCPFQARLRADTPVSGIEVVLHRGSLLWG